MEIGGSISGALFEGEDHKYRYSLWRIWDKTKAALFFIGLNPSTANAIKDDPTIIMLVTLAKNLGFGGLYAGNLFSIVSSDPRILLLPSSQELPGGANDIALRQMRDLTSKALVGWGEWASLYTTANGRALEVLRIIGEPVYCLKMNMSGEPCHPLYLPRDSMLKQYQRNVYDPDSGLELKPETKKRLIESSKLPKETLVSSEGMRKLTLQNYGQKRGPKQS